VAITIGDVCGKGIPAALFMAMTQMVMRHMLRQEVDVGNAATAGNALLAASNREMMFATLFCSVIDLTTGQVSYCSCGHHSPIILRKGKAIETLAVSGLPIGLDDRAKYKTESLDLGPGDQLLLYTDGFVDAVNVDGQRFGDQRFFEVVEGLRTLPAGRLIPALIKSIDDFAGDAQQFDDLTAVLIDAIAKKPDCGQAAKGKQGTGTSLRTSSRHRMSDKTYCFGPLAVLQRSTSF
jgi:sigma-B regulation protein RsbU (phosphoserine phosphatase)